VCGSVVLCGARAVEFTRCKTDARGGLVRLLVLAAQLLRLLLVVNSVACAPTHCVSHYCVEVSVVVTRKRLFAVPVIASVIVPG
jgi:hypothetical protein